MTPPLDKVYPETLEKACTICGVPKSLDNFYKQPRGLYGKTAQCKSCCALRDKKKKEEHIKAREGKESPITKICTNKTCPHNGLSQLISNFTKASDEIDGFNNQCRTCTTASSHKWSRENAPKMRANEKRWRHENLEHVRELERERYRKNPEPKRAAKERYKNSHPNSWKEYYAKNSEKIKERGRIYGREHYRDNRTRLWASHATSACKQRAKKKSVPFAMSPSDLLDHSTGKLPEFCPIFPHIRLDYDAGPDRRCWASVDKIVPELGYVSGNVWVISMAGNTWKMNGSNRAEREIIVALMHGNKRKSEPHPQQQSLFYV